jgi:A/G-specific adenine glycosylase
LAGLLDMNDFSRELLGWYRVNGRASLPWRVRHDSYYTVVSEFMLQQTQVERVVPKFAEFVARFPDFRMLAAASTAGVLRAWKGLGYNSRAVRLKRLAEAVVERHGGVLPRDTAALRALPGVGPYTAAAVAAFAFDKDVAACDVNIRRIIHRVLYGAEHPARATNAELDRRANDLVAAGGGHDWNSAMMDLGASVCLARAPKCPICPLQSRCAAAPVDAATFEADRKRYARPRSPQAALKFERTTRYARGRVVDRLRELPPGEAISLLDLHRELESLLGERDVADVGAIVAALRSDGLVDASDGAVRLRD